MVGDSLRIGDTVKAKICQENREWGFNPCPDGTSLKILAFAEIPNTRICNFGKRPGIYENKCWIKVKFPSGETDFISTCHVIDGPKRDYKDWQDGKFLRELPETEFYEDDEVTSDWIKENFPSGSAFIHHIEYDNIGKKRNDGKPMPLYGYKWKIDENGGYMSSSCEVERDLKLVARGNVWRYFHNEQIKFESLEQEANFFRRLGHTEDVQNPRTKLYSYTLEEALEDIKSGIGDAISCDAGLFGSGRMTSISKFRDRELGRRVAALTLKGFPNHV